MIRYRRHEVAAPPALLAKGRDRLQRIIRPKATSRPPSLTSEDFEKALYGSAEVRKALWILQHRKCCFCEKKIEIKYSWVEHFRPKTRAFDLEGRSRAGYWWLGYIFENLYLACAICNNVKRDRFPLEPGARPLEAEALPWAAAEPEAALLIDPGYEDPEEHLAWVYYEGRLRVIGLDERGKATVEVTKLDRDELLELRVEHFETFLRPLLERWRAAGGDLEAPAGREVLDSARLAAAPAAPFAGMARFFLRQAGIPV